MAAPHLSPHPPRLEQRTASRKLFLYARLERVDLRRIEARRTAIAQNAQIGRGDFLHDRGAAMIGARLGLVVKLGDVRREFEYDRGREPAGARDRVEQLILRKAPHDNDPIERRAIAAPADAAVGPPRDRPDLQIQLRCGAAVERHFRLAGGMPRFRCREIEIGEFDRALQLVGARSRQEHD